MLVKGHYKSVTEGELHECHYVHSGLVLFHRDLPAGCEWGLHALSVQEPSWVSRADWHSVRGLAID